MQWGRAGNSGSKRNIPGEHRRLYVGASISPHRGAYYFRNNELSRILTRVVEIGLRGGWAEIVDQAPLKIPASVVSRTELPEPRASPRDDGSANEDHEVGRDGPRPQ